MKCVVLLSGGLDSCTALAVAKDAGDEVVLALGVRYGSKHNPLENLAAGRIAGHYGVPFWLIDLEASMGGLRSSLMAGRGELPEGHYNDETMKLTVVPGRNLIFIAHAAAHAESVGAGLVYLGTHAGDHAIYPDCRPAFLTAAGAAVKYGSDGKVQLKSPFTNWLKMDIVARGYDLGAPYHLTRTCYSENPVACSRCGACRERIEAFALNGLTDPLEYQPKTG